MENLKREDRQTWRMEPDFYDGETCDKVRPRWMTSYPKEGDEEEGETLKIELDARSMPPGTIVTITVPICPKCGDPADMMIPREGHKGRKWPNCQCGFSWNKWAEGIYS